MRFTKMQGCGNDYIYVDCFAEPMPHDPAGLSHRISDRHFGIVVDDRSAVRELVKAAGGQLLPGPFLDFLDPWGNRIEVVDYADVQFTKAPHVLGGMGLKLDKNPKAIREP